MSVLVNQLRARAECIRATNFVHISEQDAREFADLFDQAANELEYHENHAEVMSDINEFD
jgi:hypothetical protein